MLDWGMILETNDHKTALEEMYAKEPLEELSIRLGVAKLSLRAKIIQEGIPMRPQGGVNPLTKRGKSRLDCLDPDIFERLTPQEIAKQFDMHPSAVYKHIRRNNLKYRRQRESIPRQGDLLQATEVQGSSDVGEGVVEDDTPGDGTVREVDVVRPVREEL